MVSLVSPILFIVFEDLIKRTKNTSDKTEVCFTICDGDEIEQYIHSEIYKDYEKNNIERKDYNKI